MAVATVTKTTKIKMTKILHHPDHAEQQKLLTFVRKDMIKKGMQSHIATPMEPVGISPTLAAVACIQEISIKKWQLYQIKWEAVAISTRKRLPEMLAVVNV